MNKARQYNSSTSGISKGPLSIFFFGSLDDSAHSEIVSKMFASNFLEETVLKPNIDIPVKTTYTFIEWMTFRFFFKNGEFHKEVETLS